MQIRRFHPVHSQRENEAILWVMIVVLLVVTVYAALALLEKLAIQS